MPTQTFTTSGTWPVPNGATSVTVQATGEGGAGVTPATSHHGGPGGGGGAFAQQVITVTYGSTLTITIGTGGSATATVVSGGSITVTANYGASGTGSTPGAGGAAGSYTIAFAGGTGGTGASGSTGTGGGGGGGGSAGSTGAGGNGGAGGIGTAGSAGAAGTGSPAGAAGGAGSGVPGTAGTAGASPGAGGGGGADATSGGSAGGAGAPGQVILTWTVPSGPSGVASGTGEFASTKKAAGSFRGILSAIMAPPVPMVVNQWAGTFAQPAAFQTTPPAMKSTVVALDPASSVGGGSGTPSAGNWLFAIVGWNQQMGASPVTFGVGDDIHSFWRCAPPSSSAGATRTVIWYTPNLARTAQDVYAAPNGCVDGDAVLVIEVTGLGPWDTVTATDTAYAAAATTLGLSLPAPPGPAFTLAGITGDSTAAGQAFSPGMWTTLATVQASDGVDHVADAVLTSAFLPVTTTAISVGGTATSGSDLSGFAIQVLINAPSPLPAGINPNWPYIIPEMALGSGFQTPPDQQVWTPLTSPKRWWGLNNEVTGVQYQLGELQSTSATWVMANLEGAFSPGNPGSMFYSNAINANMSFNGVFPVAGLAGWTATDGAQIALSSAQSFASAPTATATYSMMVTPSGSTADPGAQAELDPVTAGDVYSVSAWFYSPAGWGTGAQVGIAWYSTTSTSSLISTSWSSAAPIPAADWAAGQVSLANVTAPAGAAYGSIVVQFAGTPAASAPYFVAEPALVSGGTIVQTGLVATGTPIRLRCALGTMGGTTYNRWYVISRNAIAFPEARTSRAWLGYVPLKASDQWSVAGRALPSPYRGEVYQDMITSGGTCWWYPCDDQPLVGGVLPTSLRNAAPGNSNPLQIIASPNGVGSQDTYSSTGTDLTATYYGTTSVPPGNIAVYSVAAGSQWMCGDPQSSPSANATGGAVTASPGSAAWQQTGVAGNTGSHAWFLAVNDSFPPLANGVTVKAWANYPFAAGASGFSVPPDYYTVATQPYCPLTLLELATATEPVAILQLDQSGHLQLITYNGSTGTSHAIYTASDLRNGGFNSVAMTLTATTWTVYLNGGTSAGGVTASGTATGMTSAWTWLIANGDLGTGGGSALSGIQHSGNVSLSHIEIYPRILPAYRIMAHYCAAITGFGLLPAPSSPTLSTVMNAEATGFDPDGVEYQGSYGLGPAAFAMSMVATATAGNYTSGPSARTAIAAIGTENPYSFGPAVWAGVSALAPSVSIYTSATAGTETEAAVICGTGDVFTAGYGSGASGHGVCQTSAGSGASPPSAASPLGDTVAEGIERAMYYGALTYPLRSIDSSASLLIQAALDIGGQQAGQRLINLQQSDDGLLFVDTTGAISYRSRPHMNADTVAWQLGPDTAAGQIRYQPDQEFSTDPVRGYNAVVITPYDPGGATLNAITPSSYAATQASEAQIGPRTLPVTSYLQSQAEMENQANGLLSTYGVNRRRVSKLKIDAAGTIAGWAFVLSANPGDLAQVWDQPFGAPATSAIYRLTQISGRTISYGANNSTIEGSCSVIADYVSPSGLWS